MKSICNSLRLQFSEHDKPELVLTINLPKAQAQQEVGKLKEVLANGKQLDVEIKQHRKSRSRNANALLWEVLGQMSAAIRTDKDSLYLEMLSRYGVYTHVVVKPNVVDRVKAEWRTVRELGEVTVNGQTGIQLQCYFGSSSYNSLEFSVLLDGVISEAREIGIEVDTSEMKSLLKSWGK